MVCKLSAILIATFLAVPAMAQTQTPRQALIEMFSARDQKALERHLPKIMQQRLAALSGSRGGFPTSPSDLPSAIGRKNDMRWFETGPILLLMQDPNTRLEVRVEKEDSKTTGPFARCHP